MRALEPVRAGDVERDGVRLHWEQFGEGEPTIALLPTWSIAPFAPLEVPGAVPCPPLPGGHVRRAGLWPVRIVPPSRPRTATWSSPLTRSPCSTPRGPTGRCSPDSRMGAVWAIQVAVDEPGRVPRRGLSRAGHCVRADAGRSRRVPVQRAAGLDGGVGEVQPLLLDGRRIPRLPRVLLRSVSSPNRTRPSRRRTSSAGVSRSNRRPWSPPTKASFRPACGPFRAVCERVSVPVLVIHGDKDEMSRHANGQALAELTGGQLVTIAGGGHGVLARDPVVVNRAIKRFIDGLPMRARYPDHEGFVERDGVEVAYDVYGEGGPAALLVPASPITHARSWKGLIPFLSRHLTVVTTDGRGTGRSDRPHDSECYGPDEVAADLVCGAPRREVSDVVVVAHCHATPWALRLAADHPDLVAGLVTIAPGIAVAPGHDYTAEPDRRWQDEVVDATGWSMRNRALLATRRRVPQVDRVLLRPATARAALHQAVRGHGLLGVGHRGRSDDRRARGTTGARPGARRTSCVVGCECPCLVIHGSDDRCQPLERGRRRRRAHGRRARRARRRRPPAPLPRPCHGEPADH